MENYSGLEHFIRDELEVAQSLYEQSHYRRQFSLSLQSVFFFCRKNFVYRHYIVRIFFSLGN